ncbi:magnesium transporter [Oceanidesulfovibrio indonesiensis]|nr:magnesium transporter [Oceanidesulfovibrio indonesiensis]
MTNRIHDMVEGKHWVELRKWYADHNVLETADELSRLGPEHRAVAFRLLPKDRALRVFEEMDPSEQGRLIATLRKEHVVELFREMDPDDQVRLMDELPAKIAKDLLEGLSPQERHLTSILLGYPDDTVGRIMSPEFVSLRPTMTVSQAIEKVRRAGKMAETVYTLPVTEESFRLIGVVSLRELVLARPEALVGDLMNQEVFSAHADDDQEEAARLILEAGVIALPVLDREDRLVGVFTVDDAMEVLELESTEDFALSGATTSLNMPYMSASVLRLARIRVVWLLVLVLTASISVKVLDIFEATLQSVVTLTLFIPLLIDTGGNIGAQSSTLVVRAMAVGEIRFKDVFLVILRELRVGLLLGLMLGALALLPVSYFFDPKISLVLSLSLVSICIISATSGAALPMLAKRVGVDPAVVSAPIITTLVDSLGLIVYFLFANAILDI